METFRNSNDTRQAALEAAQTDDSPSAVAFALIYLGDRISEGVIDSDTTRAIEYIGTELGEVARNVGN